MNGSDAGWFKKFLGENPNAKALRERLEEATALLATKEEVLVDQERRLSDATALAQRGTDSVRELEARVRDLTDTVTETDLSRSVAVELLKQAEAQANQLADALAAERAKLIAANQAKIKADTNSKVMAGHVQKLEKEAADLSTKVTSLEQERTRAHEARETLENALTRSELRREAMLTELTEARTSSEQANAARTQLESRVHELERELEASKDRAARCRNVSAELNTAAASALYAAVGHAVPVALRLGLQGGALNSIASAANDTSTEPALSLLQRWLDDTGLQVSLTSTSPTEVLVEISGSPRVGPSNLALGYWLSGLAMQRLRTPQVDYKLRSIEVNENGATVALRQTIKATAAE